MEIKLNAIARVNVTTSEGKYLLHEIKGINEGDLVLGKINGNAFEFKINGEDAVLWVGENCDIIEEEILLYWVYSDDKSPYEYFETRKELNEFMKHHKHYMVKYTAETYCADVTDKHYGDTIESCYVRDTMADARKEVLKELKQRNIINK